MSLTIRRYFETAALISFALVAYNAQGQMKDLNPTAVEIAQLPRFCWGQMGVPNSNGPEFNFPRACGPGMNHYCPGLVNLIRAKTATKLGDRRRFLATADAEVRYTEPGVQQNPSCSIRDHVAAAKAEIERLRLIYGSKRAREK